MHIQLDFTLHWWAVVLILIWMVWQLYVSTWTHFLAIFHLKKVEGEQGLRPVSRFMGYWVLLPRGLWRDWLLNIVATLVFLDLPGNWWRLRLWRLSIPVFPLELVTGRLQRYVDGPDGWRRRFALTLDADKLEPYDKGHIKKKEGSSG